jgi:hypothetical protein
MAAQWQIKVPTVVTAKSPFSSVQIAGQIFLSIFSYAQLRECSEDFSIATNSWTTWERREREREREKEKRKEDAELVSVYVTQKACAHAHNFVRSATKSGPDSRSSAPLRPKCKPACIARPLRSSAQLILAKLPYSKVAHRSFKKKSTTTTEDPHAHNLKK